jgi:hypothetical protein
MAIVAAFASACAAPAPPPTRTVIRGVFLPPIPSAFDLEAVPLGRWAAYLQSTDGGEGFIIRHAVVAKGPEGVTIEQVTPTIEGGRFIMAFVYGAGQERTGQSRRNISQDGDDEPRDSGTTEAPLHPRIDPSKLLGTETITVRAGTFVAKHYRDRTKYGEQFDFWVDDAVFPFGIIKLESELKQDQNNIRRFNFELAATGDGATAQITKPVRPYDPEWYLKKKPRSPAPPPAK